MTPRRSRASDLRRRTAHRRERRTVVVFCEGEASEPDYVRALRRLSAVRRDTALDIELDPGYGVPMVLVERAVRRSRDPEVDECWCLFDVESPSPHPHLDKAMSSAERHGIRVAVSNPSFELWLVLHLRDHTAFVTTADAERLSRKLDGRSGKRIDASTYLPGRHEAIVRARRLAGRHARDGTVFPEDNPSSTMSEFVAEMDPNGSDRSVPVVR